MYLVGAADRFHVPLLELLFNVRLARGRKKRGQPVHMMHDLIGNHAGFDFARPTHHGGYTPATLPVGVLLAAER